MLSPIVSSRIDSIIVDPSDKIAIEAIAAEVVRKKKLAKAAAKKVAYAALDVKRMTSPRWNRILEHGEQAGAFRVEANTVLPAIPEDLGDGIHVLTRPGVSFMARIPVVEEDELGFYHEDPGLRLIALEGQECYSSHDAQDEECQACPLRAHCASATIDRIEAIASEHDLRVADALAEAVRQHHAEQEQLAARGTVGDASTIAEALADFPADQDDPKMGSARTPEEIAKAVGGELIPTSPFEAMCFHCAKTIPAGEATVVVRGRGASHIACAEALAAS